LPFFPLDHFYGSTNSGFVLIVVDILLLQSQFGEAQAKEQKAKQAQLAKAKAAPDINPNLIEVAERVITKEKPKDPIPEIEWW
jgi:U4/U6 small nuclear ribonucleoprotein PRP3